MPLLQLHKPYLGKSRTCFKQFKVCFLYNEVTVKLNMTPLKQIAGLISIRRVQADAKQACFTQNGGFS